ncbi:MAG: ABC transporter ATP-binding protein [Nannocystaceae bacterium]
MSEPAVRVEGLTKQFRVPRRRAGLRAAFKALFRRETTDVLAVSELSFALQPGERVGFLGPNGAGKTTTLKILAGLLYPTAGQVQVCGYTPQTREHAFLRRISLVMGQKRQLSWDLPAVDTFELNRVVFEIEAATYRRRLDELVQRLEIGAVMQQPVRTLSLGERMKCELAAALLHGPKVLFLDEPTLGMDVAMQLSLREFICDYNQTYGATIILTSHYMEDVAALCPRLIVIDEGKLCFDGSIEALTRQIHPLRRVSVVAQTFPPADVLAELGRVVDPDGPRLSLDVEPARVPEAVGLLVNLPGSRNLEVRDSPLEEVMRELFAHTKKSETPS